MSSVGPFLAVVWLTFLNVLLYLLNENSVLKRYIKRRGRLFRCSNTLKSSQDRPSQFFCWDILNADHAVSGVAPVTVMLAYRLVELAVFSFTFVCQGVWGSTFGNPTFVWLIFFSNWTFIGFALTALLGCVVLTRKLWLHPSTPLAEWTLLHKCYTLLFEVVCSSAIFLTLFYWVVLYGGDTIYFDNLARHGLNVLMMIVDLLMNRIPVVTYHFQLCMLYGSVFAVFMWLYYGVSGDWVYSTLNWYRTTGFLSYAGVPFLLLFSFSITYAVASLRERFLIASDTKQQSYGPVESAGEVQLAGVAVGAL